MRDWILLLLISCQISLRFRRQLLPVDMQMPWLRQNIQFAELTIDHCFIMDNQLYTRLVDVRVQLVFLCRQPRPGHACLTSLDTCLHANLVQQIPLIVGSFKALHPVQPESLLGHLVKLMLLLSLSQWALHTSATCALTLLCTEYHPAPHVCQAKPTLDQDLVQKN